ncbi:Leucine rich repeat/Leucine-rich repeat, putative [Leishmania lindenbergi]|uniref:Leucine rich repeat/Leucine-rich repeat n=1 Tax=Leishmania lindenbergi TaxID=651832 RepID=A0AAW2ZSL6_9TRYP
MGADKILSEKLVLEKTKVKSLGDVQRLDLWGEGLTDISLVAKLPRLQVLALASNNVSSLKAFQGCSMLQELYLRKNTVADLREVSALRVLPTLSVLWLRDNPCAQHPYYREFVLYCCPRLRQLDGVEVTEEERKAAEKRMTAKAVDEILASPASPEAASSPRPKRASGSGSISPSKTTDATPSSVSGGNSDCIATIEERTASGKAVLFTTVSAQRAMLLSIVSLLSELTVESLELLQREVQERIEKQREKLTKYSQENSQ